MKILKFAALASTLMLAATTLASAQVYEVTLKVKSSLARKGKVTALCKGLPENDTGLFRKSGNVIIKGLIWGCDCDTIADPQKATSSQATYGYVFWNETSKKVLDGDFGWKLLNRIDKKYKKAEGTWLLAGEGFSIVGGGFGTIFDSIDKKCCVIKDTRLNKISGKCAGWLTMPPTVVAKGTDEVCEKCKIVAGTDDVIATAPAFSLCECFAGEGEGFDLTTVSGLWAITYSAQLSSKWNQATADGEITKLYPFPSYVVNYFAALDKKNL